MKKKSKGKKNSEENNYRQCKKNNTENKITSQQHGQTENAEKTMKFKQKAIEESKKETKISRSLKEKQ